MTTTHSEALEGRKTACSTAAEQIKLLTTLASALFVAPAVVKDLRDLPFTPYFAWSEILFALSLLSGYCALGTITKTQAEGRYLLNDGPKSWLLVQFSTYFVGLILFGLWIHSSLS